MKHLRRSLLWLALALGAAQAWAQVGAQVGPHSAPQRGLSGEIEIRQALERLNTLGSVMMIGAHPDDEREVVLAYLALGRHLRTAYLSLNRGEGGQNLVGPEQGDELGIIRTQELQSSRRIDGAEQYFTRAIDFGFSKTADETLMKWDRDKILADMVWNIRRFRPDVIILVFTGTLRDGHGNHQVSAILGKEAYTAAADPAKYPEQLAYVQPWQAKRVVNTQNLGGPGGGPPAPGQPGAGQAGAAPGADAPPAGQSGVAAQVGSGTPGGAGTPAGAAAQGGGRGGRGGGGPRAAGPGAGQAAEDVPGRIGIDVGAYSAELGASWSEIGAISRSTNRSQGQGQAERRGTQMNYFVAVAGDNASKDLFDFIDTTWNRVPGGAAVGAILKQSQDSFSPAHPEALLANLAKARSLIAAMRDPLAEQKLKELDETMLLCTGVFLDAQAENFFVTPGSNLKVALSALSRLPAQVTLTGIQLTGMDGAPTVKLDPVVLVNNQPSQYTTTVHVPENQPYSQPYWLERPKDGDAMYTIPDQRQVGLPESPPVLEAHFRLRIAGAELEVVRPVQHRYVDRVMAELVRPLVVVPAVSVELSPEPSVFAQVMPRKIDVPVRSNSGKASGDLRLDVPAGWTVEPPSRHFDLRATDEQTTLSFELTPPAANSRGVVRAIAQVGPRQISSGLHTIDYPHMVAQTLFPAAEQPVVRVEVKNLAKKVGYVMGSGDEVPASLEQMGCEVTLLTAAELARGDLSRFDAIVTGVRAYNVRADLRANYQRLFDYMSNGGTLVVQYNYAQNPGDRAILDAAHIGPYPFRNSANRVTVEEAPVTFPNPKLSLLHAPNEITEADFEDWVQERGVYFPDQFDSRYMSVLESHDPGEDPLIGGMLFARYGKGAYVFSAYDWFRELPAGVPGAFRMFANMLSAGRVQ
ncbi:MAG TPA: PIG-L family deacetylase [Bryobacteraceae bacterium]|nr:PIG-L family deacetylase [Bryobacteraceae bacterium]